MRDAKKLAATPGIMFASLPRGGHYQMYNYFYKLIMLTQLIIAALMLSSTVSATNLVGNGDFELGNVGFSSDYTFAASNTTEGQYTVRSDTTPWNFNFVAIGDHTTGSGNMFLGNGDPIANTIVWESTLISVAPNTDYFFEAWAINVCCNPGYTGANSPAVLEFSVVGSTTDSLGVVSTSLPAGNWEFIQTTWNSGSNTSVQLQIINQNTAIGGNDFALDDIRFSTESSLQEVSTPIPLWAVLGLAGLILLIRTALSGDRLKT